jgi:hypothetical protein
VFIKSNEGVVQRYASAEPEGSTDQNQNVSRIKRTENWQGKTTIFSSVGGSGMAKDSRSTDYDIDDW